LLGSVQLESRASDLSGRYPKKKDGGFDPEGTLDHRRRERQQSAAIRVSSSRSPFCLEIRLVGLTGRSKVANRDGNLYRDATALEIYEMQL